MSDDLLSDKVRELRSATEQQRISEELFRKGGNGGNGGGMSDDWKESVDRQLGQLHGDVRALLNRGVVAVVALAGLIAGQYVYFNEKFEKVTDRITAVERKVDAMDMKLDLLVERSKPADNK